MMKYENKISHKSNSTESLIFGIGKKNTLFNPCQSTGLDVRFAASRT